MKVEKVLIENHTLAYSFRNTWQLLISSITSLRNFQPEVKDDSPHRFFKTYHQHKYFFLKGQICGFVPTKCVLNTTPSFSFSLASYEKDLTVIMSSLKVKHCITQYWFRNCSDKQVKVHRKKIKVIMKKFPSCGCEENGIYSSSCLKEVFLSELCFWISPFPFFRTRASGVTYHIHRNGAKKIQEAFVSIPVNTALFQQASGSDFCVCTWPGDRYVPKQW